MFTAFVLVLDIIAALALIFLVLCIFRLLLCRPSAARLVDDDEDEKQIILPPPPSAAARHALKSRDVCSWHR